MMDEGDKEVWEQAKALGRHLGCFVDHENWKDDILVVYAAVEEVGPEVFQRLSTAMFGIEFDCKDWYVRAEKKLQAWGIIKKLSEPSSCESCQHLKKHFEQPDNIASMPSGNQEDCQECKPQSDRNHRCEPGDIL